MRSTRLLAALVLLPGLASCASSSDSGDKQQVVAGRGVITTVLPDRWTLEESYRRGDPAGIGFTASRGDDSMDFFASTTALPEYLNEDATEIDSYTFAQLVTFLQFLPLASLASGCERTAVRPFEASGYYGQVATFDSCGPEHRPTVEVVAIRAQRDAVVIVSVVADSVSVASEVATDAVAELRLDVDQVARRVGLDGVTPLEP